jgi:electron transport complex protein RnfA
MEIRKSIILAKKELFTTANSPAFYGICLFFVLFCSISLFYLSNYFSLNKADFRPYFSAFPLVFILVIASLVQLVEYFLKKSIPGLYKGMGIYLALITTNCAILAVTLDVINNNCSFTGKPYTFIESIVYAVGVALGFLLSMLLLAGIRNRLRTSPVPAFLKGTPVLFAATALLSIAFMGFKGLVQ